MQAKRLLRVSLSLGLVLGVALFLMSGAGKAEEPIKIGAPYPMVGMLASDGLEMIQPITLAVEEINAAGGLLGRQIEIVGADTKDMMPEDVKTAAEILMAAGVDVVICNYAGEPADVHIFGKFDVPYINWNDSRTAQKAIFENEELYWNVWKLPPNGEDMGPIPFKVMAELIPQDWGYKLPNKKLALLTMQLGWSQDISKDVRRVVAESGWELAVDVGHEYGNTEFGAQLIKIRKEKPAVIFFSTYTPVEVVSFMNQFLEKPTDSLIFVTYAPSVAEFMELLGKEKAEGLLWGSQETLYGTPKQQAYREKFKKRFNREPASSNCYDIVNMWAEAVKRAGDPSDYRAVVKALVSYPYTGLLGTYDIDEKTHYGKAGADYIAHRFFQIQGGFHKIIYLHDRKYVGIGDYKGDFTVPPWIKK